jgi:hypothetical protein
VLSSFSLRGGAAFAIGISLLIACGGSGDEEDNNNFRADVIECEDALARLEKCCPSFDASLVRCQYDYSKNTGCGSTSIDSVKPALTTAESSCIRKASCEEMVKTGICDRAQDARTYETHSTTSGGVLDDSPRTTQSNQTHLPVCR